MTSKAAELRERRQHRVEHPPASQLGMALVIAALATGVAATLQGRIHNANLAMAYLLGVVVAAVRYGPTAAVTNAFLAVAAFDYFFVPPTFGFKPDDPEYYITLPVMLIVALTLARLAAGMRRQAALAEFREQRLAELNAMSRDLAGERDLDALCVTAIRHLNQAFDGLSLILLPDAQRRLHYPAHLRGPKLHVPADELALAQACLDQARPTGHGTASAIGADAHFHPLSGAGGAVGVLALRVKDWQRLDAPDGQAQLQTFADQLALAVERARLSADAETARRHIEREQLRNALLAAISHDLRTPLATILGAASRLSEEPAPAEGKRRELAAAIVDEAQHMTDLVSKVLDMARFEAGGLKPQREWLVLEEIVGSVLYNLRTQTRRHTVRVRIPADLGLVQADPMLLERVLHNLVENALKYAPAGSEITIGAERRPGEIQVRVADSGPGVPAGMEESVFAKFVRANPESPSPGVGLGLTICRAIVAAHGGHIWLESAKTGADFRFTLPQSDTPPESLIEPDELE